MWRTLFWIIIAVFYSTTAMAQDCNAILEQGVRNTYRSLDINDIRQNLKNSVCGLSEQQISLARKGGGGLELPIDGIPLGISGSGSSEKVDEFRAKYCNKNSVALSDNSIRSILSLTVDDRIVDAWESCVNSGGVYVTARDLGDGFVAVKYQFRPVGAITRAKIIDPVRVIGGTCPKQRIGQDGTISNATFQVVCQRSGAGEMTIIVNTDFNSATAFLPAISEVTEGRSKIAEKQELAVCRFEAPTRPGLPQNFGTCAFQGDLGVPCSCPIHDGMGPSGPGPLIEVDGESMPLPESMPSFLKERMREQVGTKYEGKPKAPR